MRADAATAIAFCLIHIPRVFPNPDPEISRIPIHAHHIDIGDEFYVLMPSAINNFGYLSLSFILKFSKQTHPEF